MEIFWVEVGEVCWRYREPIRRYDGPECIAFLSALAIGEAKLAGNLVEFWFKKSNFARMWLRIIA